MRKKGQIKIEAKSDLCIGSGYAYAGLIDSDLYYDDVGIPFIPAKRLKGCMREVAQNELYALLQPSRIEKLLGKPGEDAVYGITIGDAYLEKYDTVYSALKQVQGIPDNPLSKVLKKQNVLELFTMVKAQTKMEDGVAKDESLRYTRVMHGILPFDEEQKPAVFEAEIYFDDDEYGTVKEEIECILKALRHIGLHRNRGLGNVRCTLVNVVKLESKIAEKEIVSDELFELDYQIQNVAPLMLSNASDRYSESYIRGRSMLGLLAGEYLRQENHTAEDEAFYDLFLNGKTSYTNLYPVKNDTIYYPAPMFFNMLKKTKKMVNVQYHYQEADGEDYNPGDGNQPKKLRGKYVDFQTFDILEVPMQIIYHHSKPTQEKKEGELYSWTAVQKNQVFSGKIFLPKKYVDLVRGLLENSELRFGKSKTAQYGTCKLKGEIIQRQRKPLKFCIKKGEYLMVTLSSDGIFIDEDKDEDKNRYTTSCETVGKLIATELKLQTEPLIADKQESQTESMQENFYPMMQTKEIYGYQSVWNLRREPVAAVEAGSTFVYRMKEDAGITKDYVGERCLEGYGQIKLWNLSEMSYKLVEEEMEKESSEAQTTDPANIKPVIKKESPKVQMTDLKKIKPLAKRAIQKEILDEIKVSALDSMEGKESGLSASMLGRVTLMLNESVQAYPNDSKNAFADFCKRIESIKRAKERQQLENQLLNSIAVMTIDTEEKKVWELTKESLPYAELLKEKDELLKQIGCDDGEREKIYLDTWEEYVKTILTYQKYLKKEEGERHEG